MRSNLPADRPVGDAGPTTARIVLVGEAPGKNEAETGKPFVGKSGIKLLGWWREVGLERSDFYITNVYPYRPPHNYIESVSLSDLEYWADELHKRLAQLDDPWLIVPTGNIALRALLGEDLFQMNVPPDERIRITKYRGSILTYEDRRGRQIKMIPTIHPAAIFHQQMKKATGSDEKANPGRTEKHCRLDWERIAHEVTFREVDLPERHVILADHPDIVQDVLCEHVGRPLSVDIETASGEIDMVGFSNDPGVAVIVALNDPRYQKAGWEYDVIKSVCESSAPKILQTGWYDAFYLWRKEGILVNNYTYDLACMHHALDPVDDHDLAYMLSRYIRHAYHKDEAKQRTKVQRYATQFEAYWNYCGIDNCTQFDLYDTFYHELSKAGMLEFYVRHYADLLPALLDMMFGGIRTDRVTRQLRQMQLLADCIRLQDELQEVAGFPLYTKKDISNEKLKKLLYQKLGLPVQRERGKRGQSGSVTVKEVALRKLQLRFPEKTSEIIPRVLENRRKMKLSTFLDDTKADADGHLRCQYVPLTDAGRLSSKENPFETGCNLQNIDREVRDTFIPDDGHVFLEADLSQAESRVVYVLTGDDFLIELARRLPHEFDAHTWNAALIFRIPENQVTKDQRYFGKRTVHGAQRGLGGDKMSDELLKEDYILTADECQRMIDTYLGEHRGLHIYFQWVKQQILRHAQLINSWGRVWNVRYEKKDDALFRRAFSFLPQSEVADLLNVWGLIPAYQWINKHCRIEEARLVAQVHDSVLISCRPELVHPIATVLHESLTRPRIYSGARGRETELSMPVEFGIGSTWKKTKEWKYLPSCDEMETAAMETLNAATAVRTRTL